MRNIVEGIVIGLIASALVIMLSLESGCTCTRFKNERVDIYRISVLQRNKMTVIVHPDGSADLLGYENDGGGEQAGKAAGAAVKEVVK